VRFHQPSRIRRATEVRLLIDKDRLKIVDEDLRISPNLAAEMGHDLAHLVEMARRNGGVVVRPFPIHVPGSLGEQDLVFVESVPPIIDTRRFLQTIIDRGFLNHATATAAMPILESLDAGSDHPVNAKLDGPVYLHELAVDYFQAADLLDRIANCGFQLYVSPDLRIEQHTLIHAEEEGRRLAGLLDDVRRFLRDKISDGRVCFLPVQRVQDGDRDKDSIDLERDVQTLKEVLSDFGGCAAVCIDDRFVNRHATATDKTGKSVPILTAVDLLRSLRLAEKLPDTDWFEMLHVLRECGFVLVPIEADELVNRLTSAALDKDGTIRETYELRIIRQYIATLRAREVVKSDEVDFLNRLSIATIFALRDLWNDERIPIEKAAACSNWLKRFCLPNPTDWMAYGDVAKREELLVNVVVLLVRLIPIFASRQAEYCAWLNCEVMEPFAPAAPGLLDRIAADVAEYISVETEELAQDEA
jgi:hypothetical protein